MADHKDIFSKIYQNKTWSIFSLYPLSGSGSTINNTILYRELLTKFIKDNNIKSVIDFGCGDWSFSKEINWEGINYLGIDVVPSVIEENKKRYSKDNIKFICKNLFQPNNEISLNDLKAELWIIKDVLQHWSNDDISKFLNQLIKQKCFKYILLTNSYTNGKNIDIKSGEFRSLNPNEYPLNVYKPKVIGFENKKAICLITY